MLSQKSVLARLLANENISVQQGNYETAFFNVETRTLGLPMWKDMGKDIYDWLVGHEVSHALYTPQDFNDYEGAKDVPHSWLNIVEDVRIEKLILRKYPGLVGNFKRAYKQTMLGELDLFGVVGKDLSKYKFMDRLNIHAKARDLVDVPFSADELPYVAQAKACETYEEVIQCCLDIQKFLKEKREQESSEDGAEKDKTITIGILTDKKSEEDDGDGVTEETAEPDIIIDMREGNSSGETEEDDTSEDDAETTDSEEPTEDAEEKEDESSDGKVPGKGAGADDDVTDVESGDENQESETEEMFESNAETLLEEGNRTYVAGYTSEQVKSLVIPYSAVAESRKTRLSGKSKFPEADYAEFIRETKKVVNLMVKEFEMRKAAWRSLRARQSSKGTLDVNKLHKYQYDDQLFKQMSHLADAKNHGMVMLVDYSGSMCEVIGSVVKQNMTLVMFCKRVGIPFEVYGFTTSGNYNTKAETMAKDVTRFSTRDLGLFKLFDSSMSKREYEEAMRMSFLQTISGYFRNGTSAYEALGGTPLNAELMAMQYVIKDFRKKYSVQKTTFVALTDGSSDSLTVYEGADGRGSRYPHEYVTEIAGKKMILPCDVRNQTIGLLDYLRETGVTTINYYIVPANRHGEIKYQIRTGRPDIDFETCNNLFRSRLKNGCVVVDNAIGYDRRFIVPSTSLSANTETLDVDEGMTVGKLASQFSKFNSSKKKSKILTQKFAEIVS